MGLAVNAEHSVSLRYSPFGTMREMEIRGWKVVTAVMMWAIYHFTHPVFSIPGLADPVGYVR